MDKKSLEIAEHVIDYFKKYLPNYTVLCIVRKSLHPDDAHLYMVVSKKDDGSYGFWECWNEGTQSLNHGNYGIENLEDCMKLLDERRNDTKYFAVYKCSQNAKFRLFVTESEEAAHNFCEENNWELTDENDFVWSLCYEETDGSD